MSLYCDRGVNLARGYNNYTYKYAPNTRASKHKANDKRSKGRDRMEHNNRRILQPHIFSNDRSSRETISNEISKLNYTLDQMDLTDIYKTFHPMATDYTFFSSIQEHSPG